MSRQTILTALLFLLLGASLAEAQRGRGGRGRRASMSVEEAQARVLDPQARDRRAAFMALVATVTREATRRDIPSFFTDPENLYLEEYRALREEFYGPIRSDPVGRRFLMELAADSSDDRDYAASSACVYLADDPRVDELVAMAEGFAGLALDDGRRDSRARHLGRAVAALRDRDAALPVVRRVLSQWEQELASPQPAVVAAALEGLARAGERDAVVDVLHQLTEGEPTRRSREIVQSSTRLLKSLDADDPSRQRALRWVRESLDAAGFGGPAIGAELLGASSPDAIRFRESILFLADMDPAESMPVLLRCYEEPDRARQMGIDGLQSLRTRLQSFRRDADEEQAAALDGYFWDVLRDTALRLFDLEEQPMTVEEQADFVARRDVRYNAASYFYSLWTAVPSVREVLDEDPEASDFLMQLVRTETEEVAGQGADRLWSALADKEETRVLCAILQARAERDLGFPEQRGLGQGLMDVLTGQIDAEPVAIDEVARRTAPYADLEAWYVVEVVQAPDDGYVRDRAIDGLRDLGYEVRSNRREILLRPSR